eukprot:6554376-Alexandrium_andersonii.AAC.1
MLAPPRVATRPPFIAAWEPQAAGKLRRRAGPSRWFPSEFVLAQRHPRTGYPHAEPAYVPDDTGHPRLSQRLHHRRITPRVR